MMGTFCRQRNNINAAVKLVPDIAVLGTPIQRVGVDEIRGGEGCKPLHKPLKSQVPLYECQLTAPRNPTAAARPNV